MFNDILVIADTFVEPPSEIMAVRTVTMIAHCNLGMSILLQSTEEMKDFIYRFAKPRGLMDYVDYILCGAEFEEGIHLDTTRIYPHTIVLKWIRIENQLTLLGQIKSLASK
jgi:hypothetical protein